MTIRELIERYRNGRAIEIGPGKSPYCVEDVVYVDKFTGNKDAMPAPDIVADADSISVADESFDFVLSSHCLEHCQNTLKTLLEWKRILRPGGVVFLILPHAERTIDRFREITTLGHHIRDLETLGDEPDHSHDAEMQAGWSQLPDAAAQREQFEREWGFPIWDWDRRHANGVLHFHVWTPSELIDVFRFLGLKILFASDCVPERPDSFVVVARK